MCGLTSFEYFMHFYVEFPSSQTGDQLLTCLTFSFFCLAEMLVLRLQICLLSRPSAPHAVLCDYLPSSTRSLTPYGSLSA